MKKKSFSSNVHTIVIGGGQAGLAVGYHLAKRKIPFLILDANARTGDSWRNRWDSLRLFMPTRHAALPGMEIPGNQNWAPTKDEMANYPRGVRETFQVSSTTQLQSRFASQAQESICGHCWR